MHQGVFADAMKKFPHLMNHYKAVAEQQGGPGGGREGERRGTL